MHPNSTPETLPQINLGHRGRLRLGGILAALILIAGCSSGSGRIAVEERSVQSNRLPSNSDQELRSDDYQSTPLENRNYEVQQARRYSEIAAQETADEAINATLSAAEFYVQAEDSQRALDTVIDLDPVLLNPSQFNRYQIVRAYTEYANSENQSALLRLQSVLDNSQNDSEAARQQRVDALLLTSFIEQRSGQYEAALSRLLERESLLFGEARAETSRYIWQVIKQIPVAERQYIMAGSADPRVRNRLEQSLTGEIGEQSDAPSRFEQWRTDSQDPNQGVFARPAQWSQSSPRSIAVLLPEDSRFQRAALAVKDGILYQHSLNESPFRPVLNFYDIGSNPAQISQYYAAALQSGNDFIIGPLGKSYADTLLSSFSGRLGRPTVLLGGEGPLSAGVTRLDLNPTHETQRVAEHATALGYINAVVLAPATASGERTANAFTQHWLRRGGKINKVVTYSPDQFDHSTEFKLMFDLNKSQARYSTLSDTLGYRPKYTPYRRNDIDFIYLIADTATGRVVRPQINFFGGNTMPVIASSAIFNGLDETSENMDLNNTVFPAMPWELTSSKVSPYAGQFNRLFALGSDAYQIAGELGQMRRGQPAALQGNTGTLTLATNGEVTIQPIWAVFKDGEAQTDSQLILDQSSRPQSSNLIQGSGRNNRNSYNESNWDPRRSSRKSSP